MRSRLRASHRLWLLALASLALGSLTACQPEEVHRIDPGEPRPAGAVEPIPRWSHMSDPSRFGWSAPMLERARKLWGQNRGRGGLVIVQGGLVVAQWGDVDRPFTVRSIRKSLVSPLFGLAIAEGKLRLDQTLAELEIDDHSPLTPAEKQATLQDLLTSRSGVYLPAAKTTPQNLRARPPRGSHAPGTFFYYNNWDFNALATVYERATGVDLLTAFATRLATPLGMEDYDPGDAEYIYEESAHPAYWLSVSARDLARFGLLVLRQGRWQGRQLVPAEWIAKSTTAHVPEAKGRSYGYLWFVVPPGDEPSVRESSVLADGAGFMWIVPEKDLVIVHLNRTNFYVLRRVLRLAADEDKTWEVLNAIVEAAPRLPSAPKPPGR